MTNLLSVQIRFYFLNFHNFTAARVYVGFLIL